MRRLYDRKEPYKYDALIKKIKKELKDPHDGHIVYYHYNHEDSQNERRRIYQTVRYHLVPPHGTRYTFAVYKNEAGDRAIGIGLAFKRPKKSKQSNDGG